MKKIILLITGFLLALGSFSQPTITEFMNLDVGDKYWVKEAGTGVNQNRITEGPNQVWDFSNLPTNGITTGSVCVTPSSTPYADSAEVQNSTHAIAPYQPENDTILLYQYLKIGAEKQEAMAQGFYHNYDNVSFGYTKWLDPHIAMKVPMTYGDSYTDQQILYLYNIAQQPPILKDTSQVTVTIVGYGTVKTPAGVFQNALLFKETVNWIWWNNYGGTVYRTEGTDINYTWRVPGIKLSVLTVCLTNGEVAVASYLWDTDFNSGGIDNPNANGNGNGNGNGGNNGGDNETPYDPSGIWLNTMAGAGEFFQQAIGSFSWTLGEAITETMMVNPTLTQGFNQPFDVLVSINELEKLQVNIYPNPFSSEITIDLGNFEKAVEAALYNTTGQIVSNFILSDPLNRIHLTECKPGMYYLRINNPENPQTFKIIKK